MPLAEVHLENFIKAAHLKHSPIFIATLKMSTTFFSNLFLHSRGKFGYFMVLVWFFDRNLKVLSLRNCLLVAVGGGCCVFFLMPTFTVFYSENVLYKDWAYR